MANATSNTQITASACSGCGDDLDSAASAGDLCPKCNLLAALMDTRDTLGGANETLDNPPDSGQQLLPPPDAPRYEPGEQIAKGGMGKILTAREIPVGRNVAMKVILDADRAADRSRLRFVEEAKITGMLEHPSIVPMHDLGLDENGNVFYTMKLVRGRTLADILSRMAAGDEETLTEFPLTRLLTIFQKICDAIAFAHSRGVIHRDLKPPNVMIGGYGEVLVMDWGLAKVMDMPELENTIQGQLDPDESAQRTRAGDVMGTLGYMPPEQAGSGDPMGPRSDIYALGAILYEILTLRKTIQPKSVDEGLDLIRTGAIDPPQTAATTAQKEPLKHWPGNRVPRSLAAVAMKALATKPAGRYANVQQLQGEIEAYQSGFATTAENAGFWKHFKLFVRRHKTESIAAGLILALLVAGLVVSDQLRRRAVEAEHLAVVAEHRATAALADSQATADFLNELLRDPAPQSDSIFRYADFINSAAERLESAENLSTESRIRLLTALGQSYNKAGRYRQAIEVLSKAHDLAEAAFGLVDERTFEVSAPLGFAYEKSSRPEKAIAIFEEIAAGRQQLLGPDDPLTLTTQRRLAMVLAFGGREEEGTALARRVLASELRLHPDQAGRIRDAKLDLVIILEEAPTEENLKEAVQLAQEALDLSLSEFGPDADETREARNRLYEIQSRFAPPTEEQIAVFRDEVARVRKRWDDNHPDVLESMRELAQRLEEAKRHDEAVTVLEEAVQLARNKVGFGSQPAILVMGKLAENYGATNRTAEAIAVVQEAVEIAREQWGEHHAHYQNLLSRLANLYQNSGRDEESLELQAQLLELKRETLGDDHPSTLGSMLVVAQRWAGLDRLADAEATANEVLRKSPSIGSQREALFILGTVARKRGELDLAIERFETAIETHDKVYGRTREGELGGLPGQLLNAYKNTERWEPMLKLADRRLAFYSQSSPWRNTALVRKAEALRGLGENEERYLPLLREAFESWRQLEASRRRLNQHIHTMVDASRFYEAAGHLEDAIEVLQVIRAEFIARDGIASGQPEWTTEHLFTLHRAAGQPEAARQLLEEMARKIEAELGPDDAKTKFWRAKLEK